MMMRKGGHSLLQHCLMTTAILDFHGDATLSRFFFVPSWSGIQEQNNQACQNYGWASTPKWHHCFHRLSELKERQHAVPEAGSWAVSKQESKATSQAVT